MTTPQRRLITTAEVHARTGIPVETLRYWRWAGRGPKSFRLGRRVVYDLDDLDSWLDEQRAAGAAQRA